MSIGEVYDREDWIRELDRLGIPFKGRHAKTQQFPIPEGIWTWYLGTENKYRSLVLRWTKSRKSLPELREKLGPATIKEAPPCDKRKKWDYRATLSPVKLGEFLNVLGERVGNEYRTDETSYPGLGETVNPKMGKHEDTLLDRLLENWDAISISRIWRKPHAKKRIEIGEIDAFGESSDGKSLLVIEAKAGAADEGVLRQLDAYLRYIAEKLDPERKVEGWIVAGRISRRLSVLLKERDDVRALTWDQLFR